MSETTPGRWRKKPVVVEARQLTRDNGSELDAVHGGEFRVQFVAVVTVGNREPLAFLGVSLREGIDGFPGMAVADVLLPPWDELTSAEHLTAVKAAAMAEARDLREQLASETRTRLHLAGERDEARSDLTQLRALAAEILAAFGPSGSGHTARIGQVQHAKWRERAGLSEGSTHA